LILSVSFFVLCLLVLPVYYIGVSTTLEDATSVWAPAWVGVLFLVGLYYVRRRSLTATVASALVVGAANIVLLLVLAILALNHVQVNNLLHSNVPLLSGRPFEPSVLQLIFGVVLAAYFGHTSVSLCGRLVLRRDPSGRALMRGCTAAQATAMLLYCLFVLAVNGAIAPRILAGESGTALAPLTIELGPLATVLGSLFVVLGMGMATIHFSLAWQASLANGCPPRQHRSWSSPASGRGCCSRSEGAGVQRTASRSASPIWDFGMAILRSAWRSWPTATSTGSRPARPARGRSSGQPAFHPSIS
jgi:hypothetical protein